MTDQLTEYGDDDILDTLHFGAQMALASVDKGRNPLTSEQARVVELHTTATLLYAITEGLAVLRERRDTPADELVRRFNGMSSDAIDEFFARETLRLQGITDPTDEQLRDRMSELSTAASFISTIPIPEEE